MKKSGAFRVSIMPEANEPQDPIETFKDGITNC